MNFLRMIMLCLLILTSSSCTNRSSNSIEPEKINYFFVNTEGDIVNPETKEPYHEREEGNEYLKNILKTPYDTILVYIHGGLNAEEAAKKQAKKIHMTFTRKMNKEIHSVFINWRSGPFISYGDHLFFHRQGEHWKWTGPLTSPFVLLEDLGRAIIRFPRTFVNTIKTYAKTYEFSEGFSGSNAYNLEGMADCASMNNQGSEDSECRDYFGSITPKKEERTGAKIFLDHIRATFSHTVGLAGNVVMDVVGPGAWDAMKRRTELMFVKSKPDDASKYSSIPQYSKLRKGGVYSFLEELERTQIKEDKKIILVGHSMGAIVVNQILTAKPNIEYDKIIYLGAACSIRDFQMSVIPYLVKNEKTTFYNYMLDPLAENMEAPYFGLAGTGSLLVQIDDIYERPVAENQRTLGRWENVMNGLNYFDVKNDGTSKEYSSTEPPEDLVKRIHLRTIPFSKNHPTTHGEMNDDKHIDYYWNDLNP